MTPDELEQQLKIIAIEWKPSPNLIDNVIDIVNAGKAKKKTSVSVRSITKLQKMINLSCVCLLLGILVIVATIYLNDTDTASAHAVPPPIWQVMQRQEAIHITIKGYGVNTEQLNGDVWYVKGKGYVRRYPQHRSFDDGNYLWSYSVERGYVQRTRSFGLDKYFGKSNFPEYRYDRVESEDIEINGQRLFCYNVKNLAPYVDGPQRMYAYVDSLNRYIKTSNWAFKDEKWILRQESFYEYDAAVDHSVFERDFDPSLEIVDLDEEFRSVIDPNVVLLERDVFGSTYAVHSVQPLKEGGFLVLVSLRYTGDEYPDRKYSTTLMDNSSSSAFGWRLKLAEAQHGNTNAQWYVLLPRKGNGQSELIKNGRTNFCDFVGVSVLNTESDKLQYDWHSFQEIKIKLDVSEQKEITFKEACQQVHRDQSNLKHVLAFLQLGVLIKEDGTPTTNSGTAKNVSESEFVQAVSDHLTYLQTRVP
jgi:hypothetical protein